MTRNCDFCGRSYQAIRETSKFCQPKCRVYNANAKKNPKAPKPQPSREPVLESGDVSLVEVTRVTLEEADRLNTVAGQQALRIAQAMSGRETGAGIAALSKALSTVMSEALEDVPAMADSLDELKARREARRHAG